jgi:hypothetical protein
LLGLAAFAAGVVDSIGGGGGLITLPALLSVGMLPHQALATNKGQAVFGAVTSFASFYRRGGIDKKRAPWAFVLGFIGSLAGAALLLAVRPEPLKPMVLVLLFGAAVLVLLPKSRLPRLSMAQPLLAFVPLGLALGVYDGFFGPGVGTMLIVGNLLLFGDSLTQASGNAKVSNLASNAASLILFASRGTIDWRVAAVMAGCNALGAAMGVRLALRVGDKLVRGVVLGVAGILMLKLGLDVLGLR